MHMRLPYPNGAKALGTRAQTSPCSEELCDAGEVGEADEAGEVGGGGRLDTVRGSKGRLGPMQVSGNGPGPIWAGCTGLRAGEFG